MPKKTEDPKNDSKNDHIVNRLNAVIALLAQESDKGVGRTILSLSNSGLRPIEIAKILGKSGKYVNKELTLFRKAKKSGDKE